MDTIGMDSYPFIAAAAAVIVVPEQDRVLPLGRRKGNPFPERVFGPPEAGKRRLNRPLAHGCSPLAVIRLTAVQPRKRGRGIEPPRRLQKGGSLT